jgi:hypothetical protein
MNFAKLNKAIDDNVVTIAKETFNGDTEYRFTLPIPKEVLGDGSFAGGYWGEGTVKVQDTALTFAINIAEDYTGEGRVKLEYTSQDGLVYTSKLEDTICEYILETYGIGCNGSEQGMQGYDYLSVDVEYVENVAEILDLILRSSVES